MKKLYFIPLYLLFTINLSAQSNWFDHNPEWHWGTTSYFLQPILISIKTYVAGDTIIENQNYRILKNLQQRRNLATLDTTYYESITGFVYDQAGKIYRRNFQGVDELIYDTTLESGDTLFFPNDCDGVNLIRQSGGGSEVVDGGILGNLEINYQNFYVAPLGEVAEFEREIRIYEGIGLIFGPWHDISGYGGFYTPNNLRCYYADPTYRFFCFSNDWFTYSVGEGECGDFSGPIPTNQIHHPIEIDLQIYPNPCINEFHLISKGLKDGTFARLTQIDGKVLKEFKIRNDETIDISDLSQGMYFLILYSGDEILGVKKIIKSGSR